MNDRSASPDAAFGQRLIQDANEHFVLEKPHILLELQTAVLVSMPASGPGVNTLGRPDCG